MTEERLNERISNLKKELKTEDFLLASVLEKLEAYKDQAKRILTYQANLKAKIKHYEDLKSSVSGQVGTKVRDKQVS